MPPCPKPGTWHTSFSERERSAHGPADDGTRNLSTSNTRSSAQPIPQFGTAKPSSWTPAAPIPEFGTGGADASQKTGPEADPPPWTGPQPEPNKARSEDVLGPGRGINCPICGKYVKGGRWQLRSHQLTSSRCLAAQNPRCQAVEACRFCGKMLAAQDAWARQQHSQHCRGQRGQAQEARRSREPQRAQSRPASAHGRRRSHSQSAAAAPRASTARCHRRPSRSREPNWNDPATYFDAEYWHNDYLLEGEQDEFTEWLEGPSPSQPQHRQGRFGDGSGDWAGPLAWEYYNKEMPERHPVDESGRVIPPSDTEALPSSNNAGRDDKQEHTSTTPGDPVLASGPSETATLQPPLHDGPAQHGDPAQSAAPDQQQEQGQPSSRWRPYDSNNDDAGGHSGNHLPWSSSSWQWWQSGDHVDNSAWRTWGDARSSWPAGRNNDAASSASAVATEQHNQNDQNEQRWQQDASWNSWEAEPASKRGNYYHGDAWRSQTQNENRYQDQTQSQSWREEREASSDDDWPLTEWTW